MNKTQLKSNHTKDPVKLTAIIIANIPSLLLRSGTAWLSFKRQAKIGGKTFQKELMNQGLDKQTSKLFTEQYLDGSNLIKMFMNQS